MSKMTNKDTDQQTLQIAPTKKLQLTKTVSTGAVQQSSRSGSKSVMVEVRKTRTYSTGESGKMVQDAKLEEKPAANKVKEQQEAAALERSLMGLTEHEKAARMKALKSANFSNAPRTTDTFIPEVKNLRLDENDLKRAEERKFKEKAKLDSPARPSAEKLTLGADENEDKKKLKAAEFDDKNSKSKWDDAKRRTGKISIHNLQEEEEKERQRSLASLRRAREKQKRQERSLTQPKEQEKITREVTIPEVISVQDLANRMSARSVDVVKSLMKLGVMATANQTIDADTAEIIVTEYGHKFKRVTEGDVENILSVTEVKEDIRARAPVVTVMGHVDHGKTSLLDSMRATDVVSGEAGGITQHIGAYRITLKTGEHITFIDTPGHAAFTSMRARGAKVTDVVILVVAADDGVMPQTIEAINHAKAANVPIIVAVNKIDKPDANSRRVKEELLTHGLVPEEFGGETQIVEVSAKAKMNLDKLQEAILLQSEMLDLKVNYEGMAKGTVLEAEVDKGRGVIATLLVQTGVLNVGDIVVAGVANGRVRAIIDDKGNNLDKATPSMPVQILGLDELPNAGDEFNEVANDKQAREITEYRMKKVRELRSKAEKVSLDKMFQQAGESATKELNVIIKADVMGSAEAISASLQKLSNEEVSVRVLHAGAGGITESDIILAKAVKALVVGFNVRANAQAKEVASRENVELKYYSIIYNVVDDVKAALSGLMSPVLKEQYLGSAEIREVFDMSKFGKVAGCYVKDGIVKRGANVRLIRDSVVIHDGKLKTLKRFKDDVKEVKDGFECGMAFENYDQILKGDTIEAYEIISEQRTL